MAFLLSIRLKPAAALLVGRGASSFRNSSQVGSHRMERMPINKKLEICANLCAIRTKSVQGSSESVSKTYNRVNVSLSDSLYQKIEEYAVMMGISLSEAARHLMLRGLEQVQVLSNAQNTVTALNQLTQTFDRALELEEASGKSRSGKPSRKRGNAGEGLVTPPQRLKNETKSQTVKDIFE